MLSSPKSLSDGRELRHQGMGAGYKNRGRIILSSRSHDHRLYCCPKQIANYLLSKTGKKMHWKARKLWAVIMTFSQLLLSSTDFS